MRIERVVAGTFSEASERARQRFGRDALVLSTSKVGNVTELLVCVDLEEEPAPVAAVTPAAAAGFRAALDDELQPAKTVVESTSERLAERTSRIDPEDGSKLVAAIRAELHALEKRLAVATTPAGLSDGMLALLEQGVSAAFARQLLTPARDFGAMAESLVAELELVTLDSVLGRDGLAVMGPAGAGKTTVVMQAGRAIRAHKECGVSALRDARPGARERFFALADRAELEASWGGVPEGLSVFDTGAMDIEELHRAAPALAARGLILCLPAHMQRGAALRWLKSGLPIAAVVITHWNACEQPLGLLSLLAEHDAPLCGLAATADVTQALGAIDRAALATDLERILQLSLSEPVQTGD
ncbi:MAG: hypothetical protein RL469_20 [Pseudomonadota bacterium]